MRGIKFRSKRSKKRLILGNQLDSYQKAIDNLDAFEKASANLEAFEKAMEKVKESERRRCINASLTIEEEILLKLREGK